MPINPPAPDPMEPVRTAIYAGKKIEAIKLYRTTVNPHAGLAEAKEFIEKAADELYALHPEKFTQAPGKAGAGCSTAMLLALVLAGIGAASFLLFVRR